MPPEIKQSTKIKPKCYPRGITCKEESVSPVRKQPVTSPTTHMDRGEMTSWSLSNFEKRANLTLASVTCMQVFLEMN